MGVGVWESVYGSQCMGVSVWECMGVSVWESVYGSQCMGVSEWKVQDLLEYNTLLATA